MIVLNKRESPKDVLPIEVSQSHDTAVVKRHGRGASKNFTVLMNVNKEVLGLL